METDHNPLTHFGRMKDLHGKVARWVLALQPYQFALSHRAGTANTNADGLPCDPGSQSKDGGISEKD